MTFASSRGNIWTKRSKEVLGGPTEKRLCGFQRPLLLLLLSARNGWSMEAWTLDHDSGMRFPLRLRLRLLVVLFFLLLLLFVLVFLPLLLFVLVVVLLLGEVNNVGADKRCWRG